MDIDEFRKYCKVFAIAIHDWNSMPGDKTRKNLLIGARELVNAAYSEGIKEGINPKILDKIIKDELTTA